MVKCIIEHGETDMGARQNIHFLRLDLLERLQSLQCPIIVGQADGEDMRRIADHMIEVANAVDAYFEAIGGVVASNSTVAINRGVFAHSVFQALDGNATFECHRAADALDEERDAA